VYALGLAQALPAAQVGALAFTALVTGNLGLIVVYRAGDSLWQTLRARNRAFAVVSALALAVCLPLAVAALLKAGRREPAAPDAGVPATAG